MKSINIIIIILLLCLVFILFYNKKIPDLYSLLYPFKNGIGIMTIKKINDDQYEVTYIENSESTTKFYSYKKLFDNINKIGAIDVKRDTRNVIMKKLIPSAEKFKLFISNKIKLLNEKNDFSSEDEKLYNYYQSQMMETNENIVDAYIIGTVNAIKLTEDNK